VRKKEVNKITELLLRRKNVEKEKRRRGKYKLRRCICTIISKSRCLKWLASFQFFFLLIKMSECLNGIYRTSTRQKVFVLKNTVILILKYKRRTLREKKGLLMLKKILQLETWKETNTVQTNEHFKQDKFSEKKTASDVSLQIVCRYFYLQKILIGNIH